MKSNIRNKIMASLTILSCVIIILIMVLPIFYYSLIAIPFADDFSYASNTIEAAEKHGSVLVAIFVRVWYEYLTFEGGMYKVFCMGVGSIPFFKGGLLGLRLYILIVHGLFYVVLFWLIKTLINRICAEHKLSISFTFFTILLYWIVNNQTNREMYTWALIQSAYVIPIITMMLGLGLYVRQLDKTEGLSKKIFYIMAIICGFLASMAPLDITVLNCGLFFITCYYGFVQMEQKKTAIVLYGFVILGAIINLVSPGNGIRHGDDWGIGLFFESLVASLTHLANKFVHVFGETPFLALSFLLIVVLFNNSNFSFEGKISYNHPGLFALFLLAGNVLVDWPYTFGSGYRWFANFEGRVDYISYICMYLLSLLWIAYFVAFIKKKVILSSKNDGKQINTLPIVAALIIVMISMVIPASKGTTTQMIMSIVDGSAHDFSNYQESILQKIKDGDDEVYIYYEHDKYDIAHPIIIGLELTDHEEDAGLIWRNNAVARFYGKKAVHMIY